MSRMVRNVILVMFAPNFMVGCSSLQGNWIGKLQCGSSDFTIDFRLEKDTRKTYTGTGQVDDVICYAGENDFPCEHEFAITVEADGGAGLQALAMKLDDCEWSYSGGKEGTECLEITDAQWDGGIIIDFETEFTDKDCEGDMTRG